MLLLGINEGFNASIVILKDKEIIFALQEERCNKIKEYVGFPRLSLKFAMAYLNLKPKDFDRICFSNHDSPQTGRDAFLKAYDTNALTFTECLRSLDFSKYRKFLSLFLMEHVNWLYRILSGRNRAVSDGNLAMQACLEELGLGDVPVVRRSHHWNHAASAYFGCRQDHENPHLVFSLDGGGDLDCAHIYVAEKGRMKLLASTHTGHSIGNLYSCTTHYMGMKPHEHEFKLMGLAAYSSGKYAAAIQEIFRSYIDLDPDNPLCFKRRIPEATYLIGARLVRDMKRARFDNVAAGLQLHTEDLVVRWIKAAIAQTGIKKIVCSGGVFMNVKANKRIAELDEVEYFDVFPSCGDETLPFGAVWSEFAENDPNNGRDIFLKTVYLGPEPDFDFEDARKKYSNQLRFEKMHDPVGQVADLLHNQKAVARCSGRMEFGARALGNRSIIADPKNCLVVPLINKMVKKRDFWMPFAPAMILENAREYIKVPRTLPQSISPWMMHTFATTDARDRFHAGVHAYDSTARAQVVSLETNPDFYNLIRAFQERSGNSVVLNTSFNLHGFPIVLGTVDACEIILNSGLEYLWVGDYLISK